MVFDRLYEFRISKYDYKYRHNGVYLKEEWTSINDVGKVFEGKMLTDSEYEYYERLYLSFIERVCAQLGITEMFVSCLEDYNNICPYSSGAHIKGTNAIIEVARDCLREKYWCKLVTDICQFHFGYDYYLYLCSSLNYDYVKDLATELGLYVEIKESPYK